MRKIKESVCVCGQKITSISAINHKRQCCEYLKYRDKCLTKEFIQREYVEKGRSLEEIRKEILVSRAFIEKKVLEFGFQLRNIKQSKATQHTKNKTIATNVDRYGDVNVLGKNSPIYEKRNNTVRQKYGVDNVFQLEEIKEQITNSHLEKYGKKRITNGQKISATRKEKFASGEYEYFSEVMSETAKKTYNKLTEEEKVDKMVHMRKFIDVNSFMSRPEEKVAFILTKLNIEFQHTLFIGPYSYDFRITNTPIVIEVQGDYWHASPERYEAHDLLSRPANKLIEAQEIWAKDINKKTYIEKYGYKVFYIWEHELRDLKSIESRLISLYEEHKDKKHPKNSKQLEEVRCSN
jgi:G:T-mismatch repair DNA endonuclease (very short patch repair protein)